MTRARIRAIGRTKLGDTVWSYAVRDRNGRLMATDNGTGWDRMLTQALRDTAAFRRLERIGYSIEGDLPSYTALMDRAVL